MTVLGTPLSALGGSKALRSAIRAYQDAAESGNERPTAEFERLVVSAIEFVRSEIDHNREHHFWHKGEAREEDAITASVAIALSGCLCGVLRVVEQYQHNGSVDLALIDDDFALLALAEAKRFHNLSTLDEGILQLLTRYWTPAVTVSALLVYSHLDDLTTNWERWENHLLQKDNDPDCACLSITPYADMNWRLSTHLPKTSNGTVRRGAGNTVNVYQVIFDGSIDPRDKSGKSAEIHQVRRYTNSQNLAELRIPDAKR
jgi:hypothetical protein